MKKEYLSFMVIAMTFVVFGIVNTSSISASPSIAQGTTRVTEAALAGEWRSSDGVVFIFNRNNFTSNVLNNNRAGGVFEISTSSQTNFITFYHDRNIEGAARYGMEFFFENPRTLLVTMEITLSADGRIITLTLENGASVTLNKQ